MNTDTDDGDHPTFEQVIVPWAICGLVAALVPVYLAWLTGPAWLHELRFMLRATTVIYWGSGLLSLVVVRRLFVHANSRRERVAELLLQASTGVGVYTLAMWRCTRPTGGSSKRDGNRGNRWDVEWSAGMQPEQSLAGMVVCAMVPGPGGATALSDEPPRTAVIGVGDNGIRIVNRLQDVAGLSGVPVVAVDPERPCLREARATVRISLKRIEPRGICGLGGPAAVAAMAERAGPEITAAVQGMGRGILVSSLGGEVGTGAAPVIARHLRGAGITVTAAVMIPALFEGPRRQRTAEAGLALLQEAADVLVVHRQEGLARAVPPSLGLRDFFCISNDVFVGMLQAILASPAGLSAGQAPAVFSTTFFRVPVTPLPDWRSASPPRAGWMCLPGIFHPGPAREEKDGE